MMPSSMRRKSEKVELLQRDELTVGGIQGSPGQTSWWEERKLLWDKDPQKSAADKGLRRIAAELRCPGMRTQISFF
jgi:hypothetical protein